MHVPHVIASQELLQGSRCDAAPQVGGVWIAPIYSWYHASFDREPDVPGAPAIENARARLGGMHQSGLSLLRTAMCWATRSAPTRVMVCWTAGEMRRLNVRSSSR